MTLAMLCQALCDPAIYPEPTATVEVRETHISVVFLTAHFAYKIKKPLNLGFLDYSTLELRHFYCHQELLLNRRLSPDVYVDVLPIHNDGGHYTFADAGPVVEYALKMRRLPAQRTLEALLRRQAVSLPTIEKVAHHLVTFHRTYALPGPPGHFGTLAQVTADWQENFAQTKACIGSTLSPQTFTCVQQAVTAFIAQHGAWFAQRVQDGHIRDCHGDLRAEHIYLEDGRITIIDCIEFNQRLRCIDVASEVAFLAMDLERLGFAAMAHGFVRAYVAGAEDLTLYRLLDFYRCYRAYVRAKVASIRLHAAPPPQERARLHHAAAACFALAAHYAARLMRPLLLITTGLIGSGKSSLAAGVAAALDLRLFSSDRVRKERAGIRPETPQQVAYGTGIYHPAVSQQTYETLAALARAALPRQEGVILDATFPTQAQRQRMAALATECGADFFVLECQTPAAIIRARLEERERTSGSVSDGRWDIFPQIQRDYEPVREMERTGHVRLDAAHGVEHCVQEALAAIQEGRP